MKDQAPELGRAAGAVTRPDEIGVIVAAIIVIMDADIESHDRIDANGIEGEQR